MTKKRKYRTRRKKYPGQSTVTYHKQISHHKSDYFTLDIKKNNMAMQKLSGTAYKMYIYLCEHLDGETYLISASLFAETTGSAIRTYQSAKQELIDNKYLVLREDGDYDFYNYPYRHHNETVFEKIAKLEAINNNDTITNEL